MEYKAKRFKFKDWLKLEDTKAKISNSTGRDGFVSGIYLYLSIALSKTVKELKECPWYEVASAFAEVNILNQPKDFPLFKSKSKKDEHVSWEYEGRSWYEWANMLAKAYGWTLEYIAELDIDDAIGMLEELLVDDQLDREWQWSITELAYPYNKQTQKNEFQPLPRPSWMEKIIEPPKKMKIPKALLPAGIIHSYKDYEKRLQ